MSRWCPTAPHDWVECGEWIRELRPHIDLYLLTDESIAAGNDDEAGRLRPNVLPAQRRHRSAQHGDRGPAKPFLHTVFRRSARLRGGAGRPIPCAAHRARRQHLQLQVAAGHGGVLRPQHLHGRDLDHLRWPGLAAGPARQHQESDGQGREHVERRPHLLRHQRNVDGEQDRRAVADPAGRHRSDRPQLPQVAPLRPGAGRRVPAVPGRLSVAAVRDLRRGAAEHRSRRRCWTSRRPGSWTGCACCCSPTASSTASSTTPAA